MPFVQKGFIKESMRWLTAASRYGIDRCPRKSALTMNQQIKPHSKVL